MDKVSEPEVQGWNKVYRDLEKIVGKQGTLAIYQEFRGLQINFPVRLISRAYMIDVLRTEYTGKNKQKLANHYGYSQRSIERMLKELEKEAQHQLEEESFPYFVPYREQALGQENEKERHIKCNTVKIVVN